MFLPWAFNSAALVETAMVGDGFICEREDARKDINVNSDLKNIVEEIY
jgi:hypothetical protein